MPPCLLNGGDIASLSVGAYQEALRQAGVWTFPGSHGGLWVRYESLGAMRFPTTLLTPPEPDEIAEILAHWKIAVVGYQLEPDPKRPANCTIYVCRDQSYDMERLSPHARRDARRALREVQIGFIGVDSLRSHGFPAFAETRKLVGLSDGTPAAFSSRCNRLSLPGHHIVAAWRNSELAAYMALSFVGESVEILESNSMLKHRGLCPTDGLANFVLTFFLAGSRSKEVSYGLSSLQSAAENSGLGQFKEKLGFRGVPAHRCFSIKPVLRPVLNRVTLGALMLAQSGWPSSRRLRKLAGVVRAVVQSEP